MHAHQLLISLSSSLAILKMLPSRLPALPRLPLLLLTHGWMSDLMYDLFYLSLPSLSLILPNPAQRLSISWMSSVSPCLTALQPLKGRKEENMVHGAEAGTLSVLHLNLCVSRSWRCHVMSESTNSL